MSSCDDPWERRYGRASRYGSYAEVNRMTPESGAALKTTSGVQDLEDARGTLSTRRGIVVLDFGGQYTQLIARRVREQQVFSAILPCSAPLAQIRSYQPAGIVLSGGPSSVYDSDAPFAD